jgi:predicted PurR-regulated permease PerM
MQLKIPFYAKAPIIFVGIFALITVLFIARGIIVPIMYSIVIAVALNPMVNFFVRKRINRVLAITTSLIFMFLVTGLMAVLLYSQIRIFTDSFPKLLDKFYEILNNSVIWASDNFSISAQKSNAFISETKAEVLRISKSSIGATINTMGNALVVLVLIPVYVFMILFYQPLLLDFIRRFFGINNQKEVNEVLISTKTIIQRYLVALLMEAGIVAALNSTGLLILGIDYAIMLGIIGALLNFIPYIGGVIATALAMMIALVTKSSATDALLVLFLFIIVQFIDNHYIIPKVVASKVRINGLISIIVVLVGGALWGIPGMFLSIPLTAILKVICDHIEGLKPWGFLLGDTMPVITIFRLKPNKK